EPFYAKGEAEWRAKHPNLEADEADAKARGYSSLEELEEVRASGMTDEEYFAAQTEPVAEPVAEQKAEPKKASRKRKQAVAVK
ncbi:unnamed protein product, partial [marine sediment metagenome]